MFSHKNIVTEHTNSVYMMHFMHFCSNASRNIQLFAVNSKQNSICKLAMWITTGPQRVKRTDVTLCMYETSVSSEARKILS